MGYFGDRPHYLRWDLHHRLLPHIAVIVVVAVVMIAHHGLGVCQFLVVSGVISFASVHELEIVEDPFIF